MTTNTMNNITRSPHKKPRLVPHQIVPEHYWSILNTRGFLAKLRI